MHPVFELLAFRDDVKLDFCVSPVGPMAKITRANNRHFGLILLLVEKSTFRMISPVSIRVLVQVQFWILF